MRSASAAMIAHLASGGTSLATIVKVTRRDGQVFGFTIHDADLVYDDGGGAVTYRTALGYLATPFEQSSDLNVDNTELRGIIDSADLTEADLRGGIWDGAELVFMALNWADLTMGHVAIETFYLGPVRLADVGYRATLVSKMQRLAERIGRIYSVDCDAELFDARCGIDAQDWTEAGSVEAVTDRATFTVPADTVHDLSQSPPAAAPDDWLNGGLVAFTSGANAGLAMEIRDWIAASRTIVLFLPMPFDIAAGDTCDIRRGCNKRGREGDCKLVFDNYLRFRGFEDIPGLDALVR